MESTNRPLFSVIIPVFNRENLIFNTILSVLEQKTNQSFEIIAVDDGSTDKSAEAIQNIKDSRVRYIYQKNAGANTARNRGIQEAKGKYIALLDSDDTFLPHHLQSSYEMLQNYPDVVLYSRIIVDRGNGKTFLKPPRALGNNEHISEYMLCDRGFLQTSTVVLPSELANKVKYKVGLPFGQDTDFAIRLFHEGAKFIMLEQPGARWLDIQDNTRVSSKSSPEVRLAWLDSVRPIITDRAYIGDCGWFIAKAHAKKGNYYKALSMYLKAVMNGCYSPSLACVICMQIFFSGNSYRKFADFYINLKQTNK